MKRIRAIFKSLQTFNIGIGVMSIIIVLIGASIVLSPLSLSAQEADGAAQTTEQVEEKETTSKERIYAFIAAGLTLGISVVAASIALSKIGSAAVAAVAEKPEIMGRTIVFAGLAEGLSILGLIVAVLILNKV